MKIYKIKLIIYLNEETKYIIFNTPIKERSQKIFSQVNFLFKYELTSLLISLDLTIPTTKSANKYILFIFFKVFYHFTIHCSISRNLLRRCDNQMLKCKTLYCYI